MIDIGVPELLIVLVIVVLVFGPGRIAKTMGEMGKGIRAFKDSFGAEEKTDTVSETNISSKEA